MKRLLSILVILPFFAAAQSPKISDDFHFALYLLGSGLKEDAATLMSHRAADCDSSRFIKGYVHYNLRQLDSATYWLEQVGSTSPLYTEARFWAALSATHQGHYPLADSLLKPLQRNTDPAVQNLLHFEQAGIALLRRDLTCFDSCNNLIHIDDYRISTEAKALQELRATLHRQQKSPWLAAGMSAIVPGLGKLYAGQLGEGIASFLIVGSFMATTAENAYKEGWGNWKTILFGGLSTIFYLGNIYGSAVSVKVGMENRNNQTDVQILYHIHIPLRNSYHR